jgi:hypothetical protein
VVGQKGFFGEFLGGSQAFGPKPPFRARKFNQAKGTNLKNEAAEDIEPSRGFIWVL